MAKKLTVDGRIDANQRFAAASSILRVLEEGLWQNERERDALAIEDHLSRRPNDPRAEVMRERLRKHRGAQKPEAPAAEPDMPRPVVAALELLRAGARPTRVDRKALIAQLEDDADVLREAIIAQTAVVDAIRSELSGELAVRLKSEYKALVVAQYRAAQALAAATDAEREFRRAVIEAGFIWRTDLLSAPLLRSALILGSERDFDSDVSRMRRALEQQKVL
jgi:hypothetical protein